MTEKRPRYMALVGQTVEQTQEQQAAYKETHEIVTLFLKSLRRIITERPDMTVEEISDLAQALYSCTEVLVMLDGKPVNVSI